MLTTRQRIAQERREARDQERYERAMEQERRRCAKYPFGTCPPKGGVPKRRPGRAYDPRVDRLSVAVRRYGGLQTDGWTARELRAAMGKGQKFSPGLFARETWRYVPPPGISRGAKSDSQIAQTMAEDGYFGFEGIASPHEFDAPQLAEALTEDLLNSEHGVLSVHHWALQ